ncbi:MAG: hypothetical protein JST35_01555 [Armatimonadetes bacterium]|nr:hypothetical protein [Armatimonadota bacterium]
MKLAVFTALAALSVASFAQTAGPKNPPTGGQTGQKGKGTKAGKPGQAGPNGRMRQGKMMQEMLGKLDLKPAQKTKIEQLMKGINAKREALMEQVKSNKITREQARPQMMQIMKDTMDGLKGILTKEQFTKLETMMKEMREKMRNGRPGGPGGPGGAPGKGGKGGKGGKPGQNPPPPAF